MSDQIYFLVFSISQILSALSHVHPFSPHFRSTISLYFVLYFFSPHLNSFSIFFLISTFPKHHINCQFSFMLSLSPLSLFQVFFFLLSSVIILGRYTHFAWHTEILAGTLVQAGTGGYLEWYGTRGFFALY